MLFLGFVSMKYFLLNEYSFCGEASIFILIFVFLKILFIIFKIFLKYLKNLKYDDVMQALGCTLSTETVHISFLWLYITQTNQKCEAFQIFSPSMRFSFSGEI